MNIQFTNYICQFNFCKETGVKNRRWKRSRALSWHITRRSEEKRMGSGLNAICNFAMSNVEDLPPVTTVYRQGWKLESLQTLTSVSPACMPPLQETKTRCTEDDTNEKLREITLKQLFAIYIRNGVYNREHFQLPLHSSFIYLSTFTILFILFLF